MPRFVPLSYCCYEEDGDQCDHLAEWFIYFIPSDLCSPDDRIGACTAHVGYLLINGLLMEGKIVSAQSKAPADQMTCETCEFYSAQLFGTDWTKGKCFLMYPPKIKWVRDTYGCISWSPPVDWEKGGI